MGKASRQGVCARNAAHRYVGNLHWLAVSHWCGAGCRAVLIHLVPHPPTFQARLEFDSKSEEVVDY